MGKNQKAWQMQCKSVEASLLAWRTVKIGEPKIILVQQQPYLVWFVAFLVDQQRYLFLPGKFSQRSKKMEYN